MLTLTHKLQAVQTAESVLRAAIADLGNATSGEALLPGQAIPDPVTGAVYCCTEPGKIDRHQLVATGA